MIVLALGSNRDGVFGTPYQSICRALSELVASGIEIRHTSKLYRTRAYGGLPQSDFLNAITIAHATQSAHALLKILKRIEAQAGRAVGKKAKGWRPRPLDLDIICYRGIVYNWRMRRPLEGKRVILPHPRAHQRAFVLQPLAEVAPFWHHPVFGLTAPEFLKRASVRQTGRILDVCEWSFNL